MVAVMLDGLDFTQGREPGGDYGSSFDVGNGQSTQPLMTALPAAPANSGDPAFGGSGSVPAASAPNHGGLLSQLGVMAPNTSLANGGIAGAGGLLESAGVLHPRAGFGGSPRVPAGGGLMTALPPPAAVKAPDAGMMTQLPAVDPAAQYKRPTPPTTAGGDGGGGIGDAIGAIAALI
jgi:hypothetical protein